MRRAVVLAAALAFAGGCATTDEDDDLPSAIDDFIAVHDLQEVRAIRSYQQFETIVLDEWYVIVHVSDDYYLLSYQQRCRILYDMPRRPDLSREGANTIYADTGTYRGCKLKSIYPITRIEADELMQIGRAPGER